MGDLAKDYRLLNEVHGKLGLERYHRFQNMIPYIVRNVKNFEQHENYRITFDIESYGSITYYPKANKLLIHKTNKWIKPAMQWIHKNIIERNNINGQN